MKNNFEGIFFQSTYTVSLKAFIASSNFGGERGRRSAREGKHMIFMAPFKRRGTVPNENRKCIQKTEIKHSGTYVVCVLFLFINSVKVSIKRPQETISLYLDLT